MNSETKRGVNLLEGNPDLKKHFEILYDHCWELYYFAEMVNGALYGRAAMLDDAKGIGRPLALYAKTLTDSVVTVQAILDGRGYGYPVDRVTLRADGNPLHTDSLTVRERV